MSLLENHALLLLSLLAHILLGARVEHVSLAQTRLVGFLSLTMETDLTEWKKKKKKTGTASGIE